MTKLILLCITLCGSFALALPAQAQVRTPGNFGLGIGGGTFARGLSIKYVRDASTSIQGNVGIFGTVDNRYGDMLALGLDFLLEQEALVDGADFALAWNFGPGVSLGLSEGRNRNYWIGGVSAVLGLVFILKPMPIDVALEYRPSVFVYNNDFNRYGGDGLATSLVRFGLHMRYFF